MSGMLKRVREGLKTLAVSITKEAGYSVTFKASSVYNQYNADFEKEKDIRKFPIVAVIVANGRTEEMPGMQGHVVLEADMVVTHRKSNEKACITDEISDIIEDVQKAVANNNTLSGLVHNVRVVSFVTDAGFTDPVGVVAISIEVEYFVDYTAA